MTKELYRLICDIDPDKQLTNEIIKRCCQILTDESFKIEDGIYKELSHEELVDKIRTDFAIAM